MGWAVFGCGVAERGLAVISGAAAVAAVTVAVAVGPAAGVEEEEEEDLEEEEEWGIRGCKEEEEEAMTLDCPDK